MPAKFESEKFVENSKVETSDLTKGSSENSSFQAFYGEQARLWERFVADTKLAIKVREAEVATETRQELGKATEGVVASKIALDDDWQNLNKRLNIANEQAGLYEMAWRTMQDRGNNIRSLLSRSKAEMEVLNLSVDTSPRSSRTPEEAKDLLRNRRTLARD